MNALRRVAGVVVLAAFTCVQSTPAVAAPDDFTMPPGVSAAISFDGAHTKGQSIAFSLQIHTEKPATFFIRFLRSDGMASPPSRIADPPGTTKSYPVFIIVDSPAHADQAWVEWQYAYLGAVTNPGANLPSNAVWKTGNRSYGMVPTMYATPPPYATPTPAPAQAKYTDPSDFTLKAFNLFPVPRCPGWYRAVADVHIGAKGAAGWVRFGHPDGTATAPVELRVASGGYLDKRYTDTYVATRGIESVRLDFRFLDRGASFGNSVESWFPPPPDGPSWEPVGTASAPYLKRVPGEPCGPAAR